MSQVPFSQRHGFAPEPETMPDDHLPEWVRTTVIGAIQDFMAEGVRATSLDIYPAIRPYVSQVLGKMAPVNPMGGPSVYYVPAILRACEWWQFYDIVEKIAKLVLGRLDDQHLDDFARRIDAILAAEGIVWQLQGTVVTRRFEPVTQEAIQKAHALLAAPKYRGPDEQFAKAIGHLNRRPQPDMENCVKDAVGALEAMANIVSGTQGQQLNVLIDREPIRSQLHPTIRQCIEKVYAYRGAAPGVSHGLVGEPTVSVDEAQWVLHMVASTLVLVAGKVH